MDTSLLGVVIPTRNSAKTLERTLLSLRDQVGSTPVLVVVDSGSTDATLNICRNWQVEVLQEPAGNMYCAVNRGIAALQTPWVTYLNSDDLVYRDGYARLLAHGVATQADVVYGHTDYIDQAERFLFPFASAPTWLLPALFAHGAMGFAQPAAIYRHPGEIDAFDTSYRHVADFVFFARCLIGGLRFARAPHPPVCAFRLTAGQLSRRERAHVDVERQRARRELGLPITPTSACGMLAWRCGHLPDYLQRFLRLRRFRTP